MAFEACAVEHYYHHYKRPKVAQVVPSFHLAKVGQSNKDQHGAPIPKLASYYKRTLGPKLERYALVPLFSNPS